MEIGIVPLLVCAVLGVVSGGAGGWFMFRWYAQRAKEHRLPFIPSYVEALEGEPNEATHFLAAVHDMTMSVHEAWNIRQSRTKNVGTIEQNLDTHGLARHCDDVITYADALKRRLAVQMDAAQRLRQASAALTHTWEHEREDKYVSTTEKIVQPIQTARGRRDTVRFDTKSDYFNSTHHFRFDRNAYQALLHIFSAIKPVPISGMNIPRILDKRVRLDQLDEADRMFLQRIQGDQAGVDLRQLDEQANQWLSGSDLEQSLLRLDESLRHLTAIAPEKLAEMGSSEAEIREDTFSRVAKGPPGFQAAQVLRSRLDETLDNWGRVQGTLDHASKTADTLKRWATDASVIESDMDYLIEAIETYRITFPNSTVRIDPMEMDDGAAIFGLATGSAIAGTVFALSLAGAMLAGG